MPNAPLLVTALTVWHPAIGIKNGQNVIFTTQKKFIPSSLEVLIDGSWQSPLLDFEELANLQGFELKVSDDSNRLKYPPSDDEDIYVRYVQS